MLTRCLFRVGREQLAFDPGRDLFPFRLGPLPRRRRHWWLPGLLGDTKRKARLQRCRRTQHIGGPGDEPIDHRPEALQLALAIRARGDVGLGSQALRSQAGPAGRRRTPARPFRNRFRFDGYRGNASVAYPLNVKRELLDWSEGVAGGRAPSADRRCSRSRGCQVLPTAGVHADERVRTGGRLWAHHAPEALQRRVSLVLVTRTQVQPVSLQTRSSPVPGAP